MFNVKMEEYQIGLIETPCEVDQDLRLSIDNAFCSTTIWSSDGTLKSPLFIVFPGCLFMCHMTCDIISYYDIISGLHCRLMEFPAIYRKNRSQLV